MGKLNRAARHARSVGVLFQAISRAEVRYSPFDATSASAREFLKQVNASKKQNSSMEIKSDLQHSRTAFQPPLVRIKYNDGAEQTIETRGLTIRDITEEIEKQARWKVSGSSNPFEGGKNPLRSK